VHGYLQCTCFNAVCMLYISRACIHYRYRSIHYNLFWVIAVCKLPIQVILANTVNYSCNLSMALVTRVCRLHQNMQAVATTTYPATTIIHGRKMSITLFAVGSAIKYYCCNLRPKKTKLYLFQNIDKGSHYSFLRRKLRP
jgi:hypothetical protein